MWEAYPFAPDEVCVAKTPLGFVDSLWEMVGPLAKGMPLLLLPSDAASRPHALLPVLREWRASRLVLVPSALRMLLDACEACDGGTPSTPPAPPPLPLPSPSRNLLPSMRVLSVSGDALPWALCVRAAALLPHVRLLNLYGCTETSADATAFDVTAAMARGSSDGGGGGGGIGVGICPLGAPIRGAHECAAGEVGEIGVGGEVVALGYLHRPRLAAAKFAQLRLRPSGRATASVAAASGAPAAAVAATTRRVFRTGDLGRWGSRGELCFLGRADRQLQLRGARLEPREVEAAYEGFALATDAAAHALAVPLLLSDDATGRDGGGLRIADGLAFVLVGASRRLSAPLRRWGEARLPAWMVPSAFVVVDSLPCLRSGKPDRLGLQRVAPQLVRLLLTHGAPYPDAASADGGGGSSGEAVEDGPVRLLSAEMGRLLGVADGLPAASRFVESGGSSVLAARLSFELRRQGWHLPPEALMRRDATVASAASAMSRLGGASAAGGGQGEGAKAAHASGEGEGEGGATAGARTPLASRLHVAATGKTGERGESAANEPAPYDEATPPLLGGAMELRPQAAGEPRAGRADMGKCVDASPVLACRVSGDPQRHSVTAFALDLCSGAVLWSAQLPDRIDLVPEIEGRLVEIYPVEPGVVVGVLPDYLGRTAAVATDGGGWCWLYAHLELDGAAGGEAECLVLKHEQAVLALALLDDGRLATGAGDGKVTLWTPSAGGAGFTESGGCRVSTPVRGLAPLPGGGFGQVGNDGVLRSFSSDAVEQHASAPCGAYLLCVAALGRGSHQLATGGDDGVVRLWAAPPPPSALACTVYFGCVDGLLYAVAPEGAPLWTFDAAGPIFSAPCAFTASLGAGLERRLLVTSQSGRLLCVEAVHGALRWEQPAEVHGHSAPAVDRASAQHGVVAADDVAARVAVVGGVDGRLHAFDCASGAPLGTTQLPGAVFSSAALCTGRVVSAAVDERRVARRIMAMRGADHR
ncbi:hypothetical protein EMIHUDRAFT_448643 [Emiliania huxleyi CCMP1516]|uniref:Carrier domain-containing protein n=2 Tax=Emiliania huxleyi TaxID=2903 RepID=A0A0D3I2B9_EMIH1|nr:hypothetical protein EMIHUDRAFT_448643 [Emiliania huxleyi CCMP1516]EOD05404.1 hypothetical protein EMIHUDRAFT_448643 [Emiliania huxleyi CCMP1516]|eukprot:XP_005757833.1 hypothetical protein EMIHUDRAFT_448643 [Emiliania huxleyi CCMP1516]